MTSATDDSPWNESDAFYEAHSKQLELMKFPYSLHKKLFYKLKYKMFDSDTGIKLDENQEEERYQATAKKTLEKNKEVFLVDHVYSFNSKTIDYFSQSEELTDRLDKMLKFSKQLMPLETTIESDPLPSAQKILNLDGKGIETSDQLPESIKEYSCVSLEENKISEIEVIFSMLASNPQISALWLSGNPFEEVIDGYEDILINEFPQISILNRKFTANLTKESLAALAAKHYGPGMEAKNNVFFDLSDRDIKVVADKTVFSVLEEATVVDLSENELELGEIIEILKNCLKLRRLEVDDLEFPQLKELASSICSISSNFEKLSGISVSEWASFENEESYEKHLKLTSIRDNIFKLCGSYEIKAGAGTDSTVWFVNDEYANFLTHSDDGNMSVFPFIYSPGNKFDGDMTVMSIMWPTKTIFENQELFRDYLPFCTEEHFRSAKLSAWFDTPSEYFISIFLKKLGRIKENSFNPSLFKEKIEQLKTGEVSFDDVFSLENFSKYKDTLNIFGETEECVKQRVKDSVTHVQPELSNLTAVDLTGEFLSSTDKVTVGQEVSSADLLFGQVNFGILYQIEAKEGCLLTNYPYSEYFTNRLNLKNIINTCFKLDSFFGISYDLSRELPEFLGHFYYNQDNRVDNRWIVKDADQSGAARLFIVDNLPSAIRLADKPSLITQPMVERPLLVENRKCDFKYYVAVTSLAPLKIKFLSKRKFKLAEKEFSMTTSNADYEIHVTSGTTKEASIEAVEAACEAAGFSLSSIDEEVKTKIESLFSAVTMKCPETIYKEGRALLGVDVLVDLSTNSPVLLGIDSKPSLTDIGDSQIVLEALLS